MGPTVTCPTLRYHPAVAAEAFASLSLLCPGRIFLALGSGEALNRELWTGRAVHYRGEHYTVDARLYDPPAAPTGPWAPTRRSTSTP